MTRDNIQEQALDVWFSNHNGWGTICLGTGWGKTRVGCLALKKVLEQTKGKALIVVPTQNLRDNEWVNEIVKWDVTKYADRIQIECINTAYKLDKEYDLIIIDEIHKALSDEFGKIHNIPTKYKMGLTGTPPDHNEEYMKRLDEWCPVIYTKTIKEGVDMGILSPYIIKNIPVTFTRKERWLYKKFDDEYNKAVKEIHKYRIKHQLKDSIFDLASKIYKDPEHNLYKTAKNYWSFMSMRKWACFKAIKKLDKSVELIQKEPERKWIVFSKHIKFVEDLVKELEKVNLNARPYHSKMKQEERQKILEDYSSNKFNILVTAEALNQGYNLPSIDRAISASGDSVALTFKQRLGRILRIEENKKAVFYNLFVDNTQEEAWVKNKIHGSI